MTGRITIDLFTTLDGVAQAPGGPEEDTSGGFRWGGWQAPVDDDVLGATVGEGIQGMDALVLGRRTYDIFAGYWPHHTTGPAGPIGRKFASIPKYVASRSVMTPEWEGTTQLRPDIAAEMDALRERHSDIHVIGSVDFVQTLLAGELYDILNLWVYPIVLGEGKKVFPDGATPARLRLTEPTLTGPSGGLRLRYAPDGRPTTGDMT
ncbi:dihydrofolate reductase family protein [Microbacterium rhizomatis]|uniref:Deaminase n=1 Tax=Microbacterium rhizomatis TaxID=1631477 RepID=A0A5J5J4G1_9MICO|nr:dihydrofolate reductase family protein [Microbacterium rhizomatis]KAA9108360.1 deaminase [Microbacterium rhizomatis]